MCRVILGATLAFALLAAAGCSGSVSGEVSSATAKTPVPAATVTIGEQQAVTDTSGRFVIDEVDTGETPVSVQAAGFGPHEAAIDVQRGENTLNVALEDGIVQGVIKENAVVRKTLSKVKVTLAGERVPEVEEGGFSVSSVPVGEQTLVVTAPGHETLKKTITIAPGENRLALTLDLTPEETYMRYYTAYRFGRYRQAYQLVHPDVRKHMAYKTFTKDMKDSSALSLKIFGTKMLSKWRPKYMKKSYKHVAAIDRAYRAQTVYGTYTDNRTQHWAPVKGRWYIVFDWR